jgi:hypothetical protein
MAWKRCIIVVANVTAASDDLFEALERRAAQHPTSFTLIVPATPFGGGPSAATAKLQEALDRLREGGLEADGTVGAADPLVAVADAWDPKRYDEIVVSTLPMRVSKWLHAGLPERIGKLTGAPVTHVVSRPTAPALASGAPPASAGAASGLGPLSVLGWGGQRARGSGS